MKGSLSVLRHKRKSLISLIFLLFCLLTIGFYSQVSDDEVPCQSKANLQDDESISLDRLPSDLADSLAGSRSDHFLGLSFSFLLFSFIYNFFLKTSSFSPNIAYRAPPAKF
jgi:hypothetical protein